MCVYIYIYMHIHTYTHARCIHAYTIRSHSALNQLSKTFLSASVSVCVFVSDR